MRKGFWKGLRTIELLIATLIMCTFLSIVAFGYDDFKCRAMQSEARFALKEIYAAQMLYFTEHDRYASLDKLMNQESRVFLPERYYKLSDQKRPNANSFAVKATGLVGTKVEGDVWVIDQENNLLNEKMVCNK